MHLIPTALHTNSLFPFSPERLFFRRPASPLPPSVPRPSAGCPVPFPAGRRESPPIAVSSAPSPAAVTVRLWLSPSLESGGHLSRRSRSSPAQTASIPPRCGSWWELSLARRPRVAQAPWGRQIPGPRAPTAELDPGGQERPVCWHGAEDGSQPSAGDPRLPTGVIA